MTRGNCQLFVLNPKMVSERPEYNFIWERNTRIFSVIVAIRHSEPSDPTLGNRNLFELLFTAIRKTHLGYFCDVRLDYQTRIATKSPTATTINVENSTAFICFDDCVSKRKFNGHHQTNGWIAASWYRFVQFEMSSRIQV